MDIQMPDGSTITIPDTSAPTPAVTGTNNSPAPAATDYTQYISSSSSPSASTPSAQDYANYFASPQGGGTQSQATFDQSGNVINVPASNYGASDPFNTAAYYGQSPAPVSDAASVPSNVYQAQGAPSQGGQGGQGGTQQVRYVQAFDPKTGQVSWVPQPIQQAGSMMGALGALMKGDFKGALNDPKGMMGVLAMLGAAGAALSKPKPVPTAQELMGQLPASPYNNFTPANQKLMDNFSANFSPKVQNVRSATYKNYAHGGSVGWQDPDDGTTRPVPNPKDFTHFASGGALSSLVQGNGSGQQDNVRAHLSPGEYVMDADTVSALGDGSTDAGAKVLDKMRANIRTHKRSAPADKIPPKAKSALAYLNGGKA